MSKSASAKPGFPGKIKFRKGDTVIVITGKDKGRTGKVLEVHPTEGKVTVEDINVVTKHKKAQPTQNNPNPQAGRIPEPAPILVSKVALMNAEGKPTRVRTETAADGTKTRVAVKGGQPIPVP